MSNTLKLRRGEETDLPTLDEGEPGFTTDNKKLYIGDGSENHQVLMHNEYSANSILKADSDDSPVALSVSEGNIVGRKSGGDIDALSASEILNILTGNADSSFSMNSKAITDVADPSNDQDAATKSYVDAIEQGLDLKDSVRAATDGTSVDLTSSSDPGSIDGVTLDDGDRVLLKDQSDAVENGIYDAVTATDPSSWTRSADSDEDDEVTAGMFTFVEEGDNNANKGFVVTTKDDITLGDTEIDFTQFSQAGQVSAGDGLIKDGDTLNVRLDIDDGGSDVTTAYGLNFGSNLDVTDDGDNKVTIDVPDDLTVMSNYDTDDLSEGSDNLYFTTSRVDDHLSGGTGIEYSSGEISIGSSVLQNSDVEDSPTDGNTDVPISSNWAHDHTDADTDVHGAGSNTLLHSGSTIDCGAFT